MRCESKGKKLKMDDKPSSLSTLKIRNKKSGFNLFSRLQYCVLIPTKQQLFKLKKLFSLVGNVARRVNLCFFKVFQSKFYKINLFVKTCDISPLFTLGFEPAVRISWFRRGLGVK